MRQSLESARATVTRGGGAADQSRGSEDAGGRGERGWEGAGGKAFGWPWGKSRANKGKVEKGCSSLVKFYSLDVSRPNTYIQKQYISRKQEHERKFFFKKALARIQLGLCGQRRLVLNARERSGGCEIIQRGKEGWRRGIPSLESQPVEK